MNNNDEVHNYEGLLLTSTSSNKRSLTNHFVDYVKKTKYFVPCTLSSPSKTTIDQSTKENQPPVSKIQVKKPREQQPKRGKNILFFSMKKKTTFIYSFVPGSLCIAYSISNDNDHTDNLILTLHGKILSL
jgi:hypothetical protein